MSRHYTMSRAALQQRRTAANKRRTNEKMTVAKVSVTNSDWARIEFGSVNRALAHFRTSAAK